MNQVNFQCTDPLHACSASLVNLATTRWFLKARVVQNIFHSFIGQCSIYREIKIVHNYLEGGFVGATNHYTHTQTEAIIKKL